MHQHLTRGVVECILSYNKKTPHRHHAAGSYERIIKMTNRLYHTENDCVKVCARCGKQLTHAYHIDNVGTVGSECVKQFQGLEMIFNKFDKWLDAAKSSHFKRQLNYLGIKYTYEFRDNDTAFTGVEYRYAFDGLSSKKPQGSIKTFAEIRKDFAARLKAKNEAR